MKVSMTWNVSTRKWAEDHDTAGLNAEEVRMDIQDAIDEVVLDKLDKYIDPDDPARGSRPISAEALVRWTRQHSDPRTAQLVEHMAIQCQQYWDRRRGSRKKSV